MLECGVDNCQKAVGLERRPADQPAVNVRLVHETFGVLRLHTPAVDDPYAIGKVLVPSPGNGLTDISMNFLRLLISGVAASADGPDRLIGDDDSPNILHLRAQLFNLGLHDMKGVVRIPLLQLLADAMDDRQA